MQVIRSIDEKNERNWLKSALSRWYGDHGFWDTAAAVDDMTYYMRTDVIRELYESLLPFKVETMKIIELPEWCFEKE